MKTNTNLQKEVEHYKLAIGVGDTVLESELRSILSQKTPFKDQDENAYKSKNSRFFKVIISMIVFLTVLTVSIMIINKTKTKYQYADLVDTPLYPEVRGNNMTLLESTIALYRSGKKNEAKQILINSSNVMSNYWLAEFYLQEEKADSALVYLPLSHEVPSKRDRVNYLNIISLYLLDRNLEMNTAISNLPKDTDTYYLDRYKKLK